MSAVDWPGLLSWSTKYHDGTAPSEFKKMSPEDKAFLEKAMEDAFSQIEDLNKVLDEGLRKLEKAEDVETKIVACEIIDRCIDDPDCARNLEVFNGISPLLSNAAAAEDEEVANRCATMLSMMIANNEKMQLAAVQKHNALDILLSGGEEVAERLRGSKKRMKLVADIVRGVPELEDLFCGEKYKGIEFLCSSISGPRASKILAVKERSVTFLRHLLATNPKTRINPQSEDVLASALAEMYANTAEFQAANMQYTENCAQLTLVAASESRKIFETVQPFVKTRMETLLRRATEDPSCSVEIDELKAILRLQPQL